MSGREIQDMGEGFSALCGGKVWIEDKGYQAGGGGGVVGSGSEKNLTNRVFGDAGRGLRG